MKTTTIGTITTTGTLLVCDPCYEKDSDDVHTIKVKSGDYQARAVTGKLKDGFFGVDSLDLYFRVSRLQIIHQDYVKQDLKYEESGINLCIDSGQACFFNPDTYQEPLKEEYALEGERYGFWFDQIINETSQIQRRNKMLEEKEKNPTYCRLLALDHMKTHEKMEEWYRRENENSEDSVKEAKYILATKEFPDYISLEKTRDFYDMICSLTSEEHHAGVYKSEGVASRSGLGDMGAELMVAKNQAGEIVAAYLEYIPLEDFITE